MKNIVEFKVTRTKNLANRRSVRWTHGRDRKTGWEIVWRLAFMARLSTHELLNQYPPSVFADHVEFEAKAWDKLLIRCGIAI